ncbi:hypothetical protein VDR63_20900 [Xanthomonas campestris pv. campestris]|uniref:hypothetical protein n=1 Tax=Xanthomonas campestris TaxID=339 RepID=UPI002B394F0F|nr:hypothetical protein [Xanthomonas campestris pv. campestris]WVL67937.1 hypothetical protein VDR24_015890 [Xanthomonas campestris pv. campestris]
MEIEVRIAHHPGSNRRYLEIKTPSEREWQLPEPKDGLFGNTNEANFYRLALEHVINLSKEGHRIIGISDTNQD